MVTTKKNELIGIEAEYRDVREERLSEEALYLPHVLKCDDTGGVCITEEKTGNLELKTEEFSYDRRELIKVLESYGRLKWIDNFHLNYTDGTEDWKRFEKIVVQSAAFAPLHMSYENPKSLVKQTLTWPVYNDGKVYGNRACVALRRRKNLPCVEIRFVRKNWPILPKVLNYSLKNYNLIEDSDFITPKPSMDTRELYNEVRVLKQSYTSNIVHMLTWWNWSHKNSLFKKTLPKLYNYLEVNETVLIEKYDAYVKDLTEKNIDYPHVKAARHVAHDVAEHTIQELYEVLEPY